MVDLAQASFAAGELAPELHGRTDIGKYYSGLAKARNAFVYKFGGVANRAGLEYMEPISARNAGNVDASQTRLIPFVHDDSDAYVLVFDNLRMRVMRNGQFVAKKHHTGISSTGSSFNRANHGITDGTYVTFERNGQALEGRTFVVETVNANSFRLLDWITRRRIQSAEVASNIRFYELYQIVTPYTSAQLSAMRYVQRSDIVTLTHPNHAPRHLTRFDHADWTITRIDFSRLGTGPEGITSNFVEVDESDDDEGDPEPDPDIPVDPSNGIELELAAGTDIDADSASVTYGTLRYGIASNESLEAITFDVTAVGYGASDFSVSIAGATLVRTPTSAGVYRYVATFAPAKDDSGVVDIKGMVNANMGSSTRTLTFDLVDTADYDLGTDTSTVFSQTGQVDSIISFRSSRYSVGSGRTITRRSRYSCYQDCGYQQGKHAGYRCVQRCSTTYYNQVTYANQNLRPQLSVQFAENPRAITTLVIEQLGTLAGAITFQGVSGHPGTVAVVGNTYTFTFTTPLARTTDISLTLLMSVSANRTGRTRTGTLTLTDGASYNLGSITAATISQNA